MKQFEATVRHVRLIARVLPIDRDDDDAVEALFKRVSRKPDTRKLPIKMKR